MKRVIFFTFTFLFCFFLIFRAEAQYKQKLSGIKKELSAAQLKELDRADNFIVSGDVFLQEVKALELEVFNLKEDMKTQSKKDKRESEKRIAELEHEGLVKLIDATKTADKGYGISSDVFKQKIEELQKSSNDVESNKASRKALYDASLKLNESKDIVNKLTDRDTYEYISKQVKTANALKHEAIDLLLDGVCLYVDCNVEENVVDNNYGNYDNTANSNNSGNNNSGNNNSVNSNSGNNNSGNNNSVNNRSYIYFTVQIIAVKNALPNIKVDNLYKGNKNVTASYHDGLWKYMVGRFDNYDEARSLQDGIGRDSFVVAFKDGERINIVDAINQTKQ